jgi:hypothetical protein
VRGSGLGGTKSSGPRDVELMVSEIGLPISEKKLLNSSATKSCKVGLSNTVYIYVFTHSSISITQKIEIHHQHNISRGINLCNKK